MKIETNKRTEYTAEFTDIAGKKRFASVCEWSNGEGWDVSIQGDGGDQQFSLTGTEWTVIKALIDASELAWVQRD